MYKNERHLQQFCTGDVPKVQECQNVDQNIPESGHISPQPPRLCSANDFGLKLTPEAVEINVGRHHRAG